MIILPTLGGIPICALIKTRYTVSSAFMLGILSEFAFCQLLFVPLVLLRVSFAASANVFLIFVILMAFFGAYLFWSHFMYGRPGRRPAPPGWELADIIVFVCMIALIVFILYNTIVLQHTDDDDSRFVVNAVDIIRTNKLFLTDPATGGALDYWKGELSKDVTSPWAIYPACIARWTSVKPVAAFHSLIPVQVVLLASFVYYALSERLFPGERMNKTMFVIFLWMVNLYGYYSLYCGETFLMTRSWQGKSVVAGVGIPALIMLFLDVYQDSTKRASYVLLILLNLAMCFLSGMGIIIGVIMVISFALVYAVEKKSIQIALWGLLICLPNILYFAIYSIIKAGG
jgi:hypothetical protein